MPVTNSFKKAQWVTLDSLRILKNKLVVAEVFNTDDNKNFDKEFAVGDTFEKKLPQRYLVRNGLQYTPQPLDRKTTNITCDQIFGIDFQWDSVEKALDMERGEEAVREQYLEPAMSQLAQEIDSRAAEFAYYNTNNVVGTLGTNAANTDIAQAAKQRLQEKSCPPGNHRMIISPALESAIVNGTTTIFNPASEISRQYKEGSMGKARGFDWYSSMSLYTHVAGTWAGTVELSAALAEGATTAALTATTGDTFKKGDIFNLQSVYAVNPATRRSTGVLQQFVILEDVTAAASAATISFAPAIAGPGGQYQNVDSLPANGADLTLFPGTTSPNGKTGVQGLALHRDAFALVGVKLANPKQGTKEIVSESRDPKTGLSISFIRDFDTASRTFINRFDILMGFGKLYSDSCAVRVVGA